MPNRAKRMILAWRIESFSYRHLFDLNMDGVAADSPVPQLGVRAFDFRG
jgi:hypothetical protein